MKGKQTCKILKQIRRDIAKANDIDLVIAECKHKDDCAGTCPRCESEVAALERGLAERRKKGLSITVAGISAGVIALGVSSCEFPFTESFQLQGDMLPSEEYQLDGDVTQIESTDGIMVPPGEIEVVTLQGDVPMPPDGDWSDDDTFQGAVPLDTDSPEKNAVTDEPMLAGMMVKE